ncbi:MAG TPA: ACT domain-containing protein [Thermodesulfobacteriota bacterium]|nr:ACT domain-containing protein [Deltaproteobacteria bacterium]HNU72168.1 ACT domain-containing protein [Thermodesulfobacteriota bacterium]HOC39483.1 ACT domain-containing protein [Thermodesulfobacteriota bacterium]
MEKIVISVVGRDRPGIVAAVSRILFEQSCNIENVSQTIQQGEFAALFIAAMPENLSQSDLLSLLKDGLRSLDLEVLLKPLSPADDASEHLAGSPFVLTTTGSDRLGLVAGVTEVLAQYHVNITTLRAVFRGGDDPSRNTMIYEVDIPAAVDFKQFRDALQQRALELGLSLNLQHRDVFESIHRI